MQCVKTIPLKLYNYGEELHTLVNSYTSGINYVSTVVYENGKPMGANNIQNKVYQAVRNLGLLSQMTCNICRQVAGTYKTLKEQIKTGQAEWQKIRYRPTNVTFSYRRDFTITKEWVSITTLDGRKKYPFHMYSSAEQYFDGSWEFAASKLVKRREGYYFHLSVSKKIPDPPELEETSTFMGVDVGMNWLAVVNTTDNKCKFFCGGEAKNLKNTYSSMRTRLQAKGTLSAKRMLKHLSGKERRLMANMNHTVSKQIVQFALDNKVDCIGLEDLTGIRTNTIHKTHKKNRYQKSSWSYHELQFMIAYKAEAAGIRVEYIDPEYTSQTCPRCYHINKSNRNGLSFTCKCCGYTLHSDLIGAKNIEVRTRDYRYTLESQGCEVSHPDECPEFMQSLKPRPSGRGS